MFVRMLLRFTSVVLTATPERTILEIGDDDGDDDVASVVVAAAEDVACETAGALVERAFAAVVTLRAVVTLAFGAAATFVLRDKRN